MNNLKNHSSIQNVKFKLKKKLVCLKYSFQLCATTSPVTYHNVVKVDKKSQSSIIVKLQRNTFALFVCVRSHFCTSKVCAFTLLQM